MYSICKLAHPATGVEHALTCYFFSRTEKSLVVASANIIRVFRLIPDVDPASKKDVYTGILISIVIRVLLTTKFSTLYFCYILYQF
jgi:hypothetical protein